MLPIRVIDNFLDDPDEWRRIALSMEYHDNDGRWHGRRTKPFDQVKPSLDAEFNFKIAQYIPELRTMNWTSMGRFQISRDEGSTSWVHEDGKGKNMKDLAAAILYLNPNPDPKSGTILCHANTSAIYDDYDYEKSKHLFNRGILAEHEIKEARDRHNSQFTEMQNVENVYNRLIFYPGSVPHRANLLSSYNETRLTVIYLLYFR